MANPESKKLQIDVVARIDKLEKEMRKAGRVVDTEMSGMERRGKAFTSKMGGIGKAAFAGFGAGALAALAPIALFNAALDTINDASKLVDTADKIGLTTTALQELSFGFAQAGVDASTFETGMEQFSKRIGEAATRGGKLADIFKANGVALRDANGEIRSSESLLGSYAELIRNATTEQEKMLLVTEAFGRGGGDMVNALNEGAAGIDRMKQAASDAGGVIDEELLRRAEEMGDRWDAAWRRFAVGSQTAILTALVGLDDLSNKFAEFEKQKNAALAGAMVGSLAGTVPDGKGERLIGPDARVSEAFGGEIQKADDKLVEALQKRYGAAATKATIIPGDKPSGGGGGGASRNAAAATALREADAVLRVIESLTEERALIGATDAQRATANALRQAGSAATAGQRAEIEALVSALYRERDASEAAAQASEELRDVGRDVLGGVISDLRAGKDEAEIFAGVIDKLADKLTDLALDGIFGGGNAGGLFAGIGKLFGFAKGGYTGSAGTQQPAGVVHGKEFVVNARATAKHRGLLEAVNAGMPGYAAGGFVAPTLASVPSIKPASENRVHVTVGVSADANGNLLPFVESVTQAGIQKAAPKIVQASVSQGQKVTQKNMGGYMAQAKTRSL